MKTFYIAIKLTVRDEAEQSDVFHNMDYEVKHPMIVETEATEISETYIQ